MNESGNHHSQQTDTRTENQTPYVITHSWVLNYENTCTQGGENHTLQSVGVLREGQWRWRRWGGITWGEMPDIGDGDGGSKPHCHVCTYTIILHVFYMYPKPKTQ